MKLNSPYIREDFLDFLDEFIPGFEKDVRDVDASKLHTINKAHSLGVSKKLDLYVFELHHDGGLDKRVILTNDAFRIMKRSAIYRALAIFRSKDSDQWRLSLMVATPQITEGGKVVTEWSNPRRFSFLLGRGAKINTPYNFLIKKGSVKDFDDLKDRFAIEVVNEQFYRQIADLYIKLIGGEKGKGKKKKSYDGVLVLPSSDKDELQEFAVRLIGRLVFCWFLKEKKGDKSIPLVSEELLSLSAVKEKNDYYHSVLEPLFFEILNTPIHSRKPKYEDDPYSKIPYLNGGLFSPHANDFYSSNEGRQAVNHNIVKVPDDWLEKFITILDQYNFTIDENTSVDIELSVDPEMLGRIFENLLAEINPDTGETARKSTGSFYTPREIVEYMVDQSLVEYLFTQTDIEREKLEALVSYDELDDLDHPLSESEKEKIVNTLSSLKALDPACGSGAFPIGLLQKIVLMLQRIDPDANLWFEQKIEGITDVALKKAIKERFSSENLDYIRKLGVIRDTIFGVDIQPVATEIARLRCFLTLIVEEDIEDDKPNRGIEPLPNLDFKFVTANTLIPLPEEEAKQEVMFDDREGIEKLKVLRERYFTASNSERQRVKDEFKETQKDMLMHMVRLKSGGDRTVALSNWDPFSEKMTSWFDPEWMFGVEAFDTVIGNPPYVSTEKIDEPLKSKYEEIYKEIHRSRIDIYAYFYFRGLELAKENTGLLCYITSNKWMRAGYGKKSREYFTEKNPVKLIDFGGFKVFESATVDTNILLIQNSENGQQLEACHFKNDYKKDNSIHEYFELNKVVLKNLSSDPWFIAVPEVVHLKKKIEKVGTPLKEWDINISRGIITGLNEAFIIDKQKRDELIAKDPKSEAIIKPMLRGRNIRRYGYDLDNEYIITVKFGAYKTLEEEYPAVYEYLKQFEDKLKARGQCKATRSGKRKSDDYPGQHHWLELDNNPKDSYLEEFEKEKVVWPMVSSGNGMFAVVDKGIYLNNKCYLITSPFNQFLTAIFNSKLAWFIFSNQESGLGEKGLEIRKKGVEEFVLPQNSKENIDEITELTKNIQQQKKNNSKVDTSDLENQIDELVMSLYKLSEEEKEIIRNS